MGWQQVGAIKTVDSNVREEIESLRSELMALRASIAEEARNAARDIPAAKDGRDGVSVSGALIDRSGHLLVTLSDGSHHDVGSVVGKDADVAVLRQMVADAVDEIPRPRDGIDGKDGLGFDDYDEELEDEGRVLVRRWKSGDRVKEFRHQTGWQIWRGIYQAGKTYQRGDTATWSGAMWHANTATAAKPGESPDWTLCVKRGAEGKIGPPGKQGEPGPRGEKGLDGGRYRG
jgi:integrin beta 3